MVLCNRCLQVKISGQRGLFHDQLCHTAASMARFLIFSLFFSTELCFIGGGVQGRRADAKGQVSEWDQDT